MHPYLYLLPFSFHLLPGGKESYSLFSLPIQTSPFARIRSDRLSPICLPAAQTFTHFIKFNPYICLLFISQRSNRFHSSSFLSQCSVSTFLLKTCPLHPTLLVLEFATLHFFLHFLSKTIVIPENYICILLRFAPFISQTHPAGFLVLLPFHQSSRYFDVFFNEEYRDYRDMIQHNHSLHTALSLTVPLRRTRPIMALGCRVSVGDNYQTRE